MKRFFLCLTILCAISLPAFADTIICDMNAATIQSPLLQQGFQDASDDILGNETEARKARQVLTNVQRIFLHPGSQSILMYGWSQLPDPLTRDAEKNSFLLQRMERLKREAASGGHKFDYQLQSGQPITVAFQIAYANKPWPKREEGIEIVAGDQCWVTVKLGGNAISNKKADSEFIDRIHDEFSRIRKSFQPNTSAVSTSSNIFQMHQLPDFDFENFWAFTLPTLILAFLCGVIIVRAAAPLENIHVAIYFKAMTGLWIVYALLISVFQPVFVQNGFIPHLEHYIYAAMMIVIHGLGILFGPVMAVPSVAIALGHALRTICFLFLNYQLAPRILWFDVGIMILISLYVLFAGFRRRGPMARSIGNRPNVIDRS
ncbi:MAG: hypothetical protein EYC62_02370 [Alphaproteobacteria bacterium]|nr:MAG: hypothetical protein EYC62_02370 [Alphaproteobacteria bacterium]